MQIQIADKTSCAQGLLSKAKLRIIPSDVEIATMLDLFENLIGSGVTKENILKRLTAFIKFVEMAKDSLIPDWLRMLVRTYQQQSDAAVNGKPLFYNSSFMSLAAYLFKLRLIVYSIKNGKLTTQYFGAARHPKSRVYMTGSKYLSVVKTNNKKPNRICFKRSSIAHLKTMDVSPCLTNPQLHNSKSAKKPVCLDFSLDDSDSDETEHLDLTPAPKDGKVFSETVLPSDLFETPRTSEDLSSGANDYDAPYIPEANHVIEEPTQKMIKEVFCFSSSHGQSVDQSTKDSPVYIPSTFKDKILYESKDHDTGRLKFYNENKGFGFIVSSSGKDIFVHKDDLLRANINTCQLDYMRGFYDIIMKYRYIEYKGKVKNNNKAIDIRIVELNATG